MHQTFIVGALLGIAFSGAISAPINPPASAQEATPNSALDVPRPDECRVTPREPNALVTVLGTPTAAAPQAPIAPVESELPAGNPADEATLAAVTETTRQFVACINAGDTFRSLAVVTDDFLRRQLGGRTPTEEQLAELESQLTAAAAASPVALDGANRGGLVAIRDARRLPDGRVGALVVVEAAGLDAPPATAFFSFVETEGQWLIDDIVSLADGPAATPVP